MHRLFVGLDPPEDVKDALIDRMGGVEGARWQSDAQLHLTLKFAGEVDRHTANDIAEALAGLRSAPFTLTLSGTGTFDRRGRIEALWVGVRPPEPVTALHRKVDQALTLVGVPADTRAFVPHVTIARFSRGAGAGPLAAFLAQAPIEAPDWPVDDLCLYESRLGTGGASYTIVERYPLG